MKKLFAGLALAALSYGGEFQYTQRTEITGGSMKQMMGMLGRFAKGALEPTVSTTYVKDGKMANKSDKSNSIMDADTGSITMIDYEKKEYSTVTFEEMMAAMQRMSAKMQGRKPEAQAQIALRVDVQDKGAGKTVQGIGTNAVLMTIHTDTTVTDNKSGQQATITSSLENDMHLGKVPGAEALQEFAKRLNGRFPLQQIPMQAMMQGGIDYKGLQEAGKKMAEYEGLPLFSVVRMTNEGMPGMPAMPPRQQQSRSGRSAEDVARDNANAEANSATSQAVSAVAGRLGRFGGLASRNRPNVRVPENKSSNPPAPAPEPAPSQTPNNVLMEITSEVTSFSSAAIDPSVFQVPPGFKQVEHPIVKASR
jgi:hypothetical protein